MNNKNMNDENKAVGKKTTAKKLLAKAEYQQLLDILKKRFTDNIHRHGGIEWEQVEAKLSGSPMKMWSLFQMEKTGGEPDVFYIDHHTNEFVFCDCAKESPAGRRNLCYDDVALNNRKKNKPEGSALSYADEINIDIMNEEEYRHLQMTDAYDLKTSSWIKTPDSIRTLGGALFCDRRYGHVFTYHNGADSYYSARGFRGILRV